MLEKHEEILFGKKDNVGMLDWLREEVEDHYEGDKEPVVYANSLTEGDEMRKGSFPSIQIYPNSDNFKRKTDGYMLHEITIALIVSTKGPRNEAFKESSYMAEDLYTHFRNVVPRIGPVRDPPVEGEIVYAWEGFQRKRHRNLQMSHSKVDLTYQFRC